MLAKSKSKDSKCDCDTEYETQGEKKAKKPGIEKRDKKNVKKTSHSAQTDVDERQRRESRPLNFRAMFSNIFDGVGPWIPYIGGSAILLTLLGLVTNNVDMLLGMFEFQFEEKSSTPWPSPFAPASPWKAPSAPVTPPPEDSCKAKCTFRVNKDKIKWPDT